MTEFSWRLPTEGDARIDTLGLRELSTGRAAAAGYFPQAHGHRHTDRSTFTYLDYLARVAKAAETAGFTSVLVPDNPAGEEPWIVAGALLRETRRLRFVPSFHSAIVKPVHAARATATYQRHSGNRLDWNILAGENDRLQRRYGDFAPIEQRYHRNGEFIDIARGVLSQSPFSYEGEIYQVDKGGLKSPMADVALPRVYLSGASDVALDVAARYADIYVTWLEPLEALGPKIEALTASAAQYGRKLAFGVRVDVIARPDEEEAWEEARRRHAQRAEHAREIAGDDIDGAAAERTYAAPFVAASRFEASIVGPQRWAGAGATRPGPAITIVGDYAQTATLLDSYRALGVEHFLLGGTPHLDEAYRLGEEVLPRLRTAHRAAA